MHEAADAVLAGLGLGEDLLDGGAVGEANAGSGGVDHELAGEVASEGVFLVDEEAAQGVRCAECGIGHRKNLHWRKSMFAELADGA